MKIGMIGKLALVLWCVTLGTMGWFFVHGNTGGSTTDGRTKIQLKPAERDLVLKEMRALLTATHHILEGISDADLQWVSKEANAAGMAAAADVNPVLMAKLPLSFKSLGMSVHEDMDEISRAAAGGEAAPRLLKRLTSTMTKCVACHESWELSLDGPKAESLNN